MSAAYTLTAVIAILAVMASGGGLRPDWYRDNALFSAGWWGNDIGRPDRMPHLVGARALDDQC